MSATAKLYRRATGAILKWSELEKSEPPHCLSGYKLCAGCGQPMLKKGQMRKHPDDYRHAQGCPNDRQNP